MRRRVDADDKFYKQSATRSKSNKLAKPYPDFPLFAHNSGRWAKKIRGKLHYFGPWRDPDGALQRYLDTKDDLHAGRTPRKTGDGLTIADLCNRYLTHKRHLLDSREIKPRTFQDCYQTCDRLVEAFGRNRLVSDLASDDFSSLRAELANTQGPVALGDSINRIRGVFKFAFDSGLIDRPVRYGPGFKKPGRKVLRQQREQNGPRMFEAEELRRILDEADPILRSMVLFGINSGFGQSDISGLPISAVDLERGWLDYPRSKTSIERRCPLWPETISALREASQMKPDPRDPKDAGLCFLTKWGRPWVRLTDGDRRAWTDAIGRAFGRLLVRLELKRPGLNFYAIRHTFQTIGGEAKDPEAVSAIMGHSDDSMSAVYRERISNERLRAVVEFAHNWLWSDGVDDTT